MYFWNINQLAEDFKNDIVPEIQQLYYLLIYVGLSLVFYDYIDDLLGSREITPIDTAAFLCSLMITIGGIVLCYQSARKTPQKNGFIVRYICLSFPVSIRLTVYFFAAIIVLSIISNLGFSMPSLESYLDSDSTTWFDVSAICILESIYYLYLYQAIKKSYP